MKNLDTESAGKFTGKNRIFGALIILVPLALFGASLVIHDSDIRESQKANFIRRYVDIGELLSGRASFALDENRGIDDKFASDLYSLPSLLDEVKIIMLVDKLNHPIFSAGAAVNKGDYLAWAGLSALSGRHGEVLSDESGGEYAVFSFPVVRDGEIIAALIMGVDEKNSLYESGPKSISSAALFLIPLSIWVIMVIVGVYRLQSRREKIESLRLAELKLTSPGYRFGDIRRSTEALLETLVSALKLKESTIYLKDSSSGEIKSYASFSLLKVPGASADGIFDPADPRLLAITEKKALLYSLSKSGHARLLKRTDKYERARRIALPLVAGDRAFGLLDIGINSQTRLSDEFLVYCRRFSERIAESIRGALDHVESAGQLSEIRETLKAVEEVNTSQNLPTAFSKITKSVTETKNIRFCRVFLVDESGLNLILMSETWTGEGIQTGNPDIAYKIEEMPIYKIAMLSGQSQEIRSEDIEKDYRLGNYPGFPARDCQILIVPILCDGNQLGCLSVGVERYQEFPGELRTRLENLAGFLASAIYRVQTCIRLKRLIDKMSASQNRAIQNERLAAITDLSKALSESLVPIMRLLRENIDELGIRPSNGETSSILESIDREIEKYSEIVKRFKMFVDIGKNAHLQQIELAQIIGETAKEMEGNLEACNKDAGRIALKLQIAGSGQIYGDRENLKAMMRELIRNSAESMADGGEIVIETRVELNLGVLEITDQGCGMSDEVKKRIFEPFFTTRGGADRGLGMSMVYSIVTAHKGSIDIISEAGKGSRIIIKIPLIDPEQTALFNIKKGTTRNIPLSLS